MTKCIFHKTTCWMKGCSYFIDGGVWAYVRGCCFTVQ